MNDPTGSDGVRNAALSTTRSGLPEARGTGETSDGFQARSEPLKSSYNSTFIILVLAVALLLGFALLVWPSGGF